MVTKEGEEYLLIEVCGGRFSHLGRVCIQKTSVVIVLLVKIEGKPRNLIFDDDQADSRKSFEDAAEDE